MSAETSVYRQPAVLAAEVDGETVLLDSEQGVYFGLNAVGAKCWALADGRTVSALHQALLAEYEVESGILWDDLQRLLGELAANHLVVLEEPR